MNRRLTPVREDQLERTPTSDLYRTSTLALKGLHAENIRLRKQVAHARRQADEHADRAERLERRLKGALYCLYGDWDKVAKEMPS